MLRRSLAGSALLVSLAVTGRLAAQAGGGGADAAAATITGADVARRVGIIADDSMLGRDTPSRGLELTARYVADQFRAFGLEPGGDNGSWFQRYGISRRRFDAAGSTITVRSGRVTSVAKFDSSARYVQGDVPNRPLGGAAMLVGGALGPEDVARMSLHNKVVLYIPAPVEKSASRGSQVARALRLAQPIAIVVLSDRPTADFVARAAAPSPGRLAVDLKLPSPPVVELRADDIAPALRAAGLDLHRVRAETRPVGRPVPDLRLTLDLRDSVLEMLTAPNTVGILRGSDPRLRHEYLVVSAHMDHIGISPGRPDSVNNGADDDASGTTGVIELAEAFSRPGARPRRSIIFLTVSGEEKGLWGSRYFSEHPPVPIDDIVADLNIDMIGRNWRDTIVAIGRRQSDLGATLARVGAAHPELAMTAVDDRWPEERFYFRSDHYNFARKGVPILFFFNGVHADYHQVTDSPDKIDSEKESRILRLLYYLGREIGDTPQRPKWDPASYREIVEAPEGR